LPTPPRSACNPIFPGVPYQFFVIVPYVVAIVSLAVGSRNSRMPAALGIPFFSQR
jgi:simple sugar transport system permease protein